MEKQKGITLISLVVTIVVLLILAVVSISMIVGQNGIVSQAKKGSEKTIEATLEEQVILDSYDKYISDSVLGKENSGKNLRIYTSISHDYDDDVLVMDVPIIQTVYIIPRI